MEILLEDLLLIAEVVPQAQWTFTKALLEQKVLESLFKFAKKSLSQLSQHKSEADAGYFGISMLLMY